jgi:hypothetical protein
VSDAGRPACKLRDGMSFVEFLAAGHEDCVYDLGDAGSRTFNVSMDDDVVEKTMGHHSKKAPPVETEHRPEPEPTPNATTITMPPVVGQMTASVGVPENAIAEVKSLVPADGNASMITVALAFVGVAGGGAAIKLYQNMVKSKHDQKMKELEIEEKRADKQDDKHQACAAERVALEAKVAALGAKLEEVAAKQSSTGSSFDLGDFDPEELEERLKKIEAALKPAKGKKR